MGFKQIENYVKHVYGTTGTQIVNRMVRERLDTESTTRDLRKDIDDDEDEVIKKDVREELKKELNRNFKVFKSRAQAKRYLLKNKNKGKLPHILIRTKRNGREVLTNVNPDSILKRHTVAHTEVIHAKNWEEAELKINLGIDSVIKYNTKVVVDIDGKRKTFKGGDLIKEQYKNIKTYLKYTTDYQLNLEAKRTAKRVEAAKFDKFRYKRTTYLQKHKSELQAILKRDIDIYRWDLENRDIQKKYLNIYKDINTINLLLQKRLDKEIMKFNVQIYRLMEKEKNAGKFKIKRRKRS